MDIDTPPRLPSLPLDLEASRFPNPGVHRHGLQQLSPGNRRVAQGTLQARGLPQRETVRLGAGLDEHGLLTEEAAQRGLACLARFAQRLKGFASWQVRAVPQTLREARQPRCVSDTANGALGHPIEVIAGREEAHLIPNRCGPPAASCPAW